MTDNIIPMTVYMSKNTREWLISTIQDKFNQAHPLEVLGSNVAAEIKKIFPEIKTGLIYKSK